MSQSTIQYKENEFLTFDIFTQLYCQYLCKTMETKGVSTYRSALQRIYDSFKMTKEGCVFTGDVAIYFDVYLKTPQDVTDMVGVLNDTKTYIATLGEEISTANLNAQEITHKTQVNEIWTWSQPIKTKSLINLTDLCIELLTKENFDKNRLYTFVGYEQSNPDEIVL